MTRVTQIKIDLSDKELVPKFHRFVTDPNTFNIYCNSYICVGAILIVGGQQLVVDSVQDVQKPTHISTTRFNISKDTTYYGHVKVSRKV